MNRKAIVWLFGQLAQYKRRIIAILLASMVLAATGILVPLLFQRLVDQAVEGCVNKSGIALLFLITFISSIPTVAVLRRKLGIEFEYNIKGVLFKHLLRLDQAFYDDKGSTVLLSQLNKGTAATDTIINILCHGQLIISIPVAIFGIYYITRHSLLATFCVTVFAILFFTCSYYLGKVLQVKREEWDTLDNNVSQRLREAIEQITTIKVHGAERGEVENYQKNKKQLMVHASSILNLFGVFWFLGEVASVMPIALTLILFLPSVADGTLSIGTLLALQMYTRSAIQPFSHLGEWYSEYKDACARLVPVIEVLEEKPTIADNENILALNPVRDSVEVKHISFQYPNTDCEVLKKVSFTIPAGKKTAIVGPSGSGKTTLAKLLARLRDPDSGVILYDGTDVRNISTGTLCKEIAYLTQEVPIFTGTIKENVALGVRECSDTLINNSLARASANFVHGMQDGVQTLVGERGKKLSGGERQRIAIARIFMRNPSFIILDEATSSLDTKAERDVHSMFDDLAVANGGRTMLVIAHRLSTVRNADQIVVLDKGVVVDIGTHVELMGRCELYQELNKEFV